MAPALPSFPLFDSFSVDNFLSILLSASQNTHYKKLVKTYFIVIQRFSFIGICFCIQHKKIYFFKKFLIFFVLCEKIHIMQDKFVEYVEKVFFPRIVEKFNKSSSGKSVIDLSKDFRFLDSCQIVTSFCLACFDFVDVNSQQFQEKFIKYLKEVS